MGNREPLDVALTLNAGWAGVWSRICDATTNGATRTVIPDEDCTLTHACVESLTIKNEDSRRMLCMAKQRQFVVMVLKSNEEIGAEVHKLDNEYFDGKKTK